MSSVYQIEKIVAYAQVGPLLYCKVKWRGFPLSEATWEAQNHITNFKFDKNLQTQQILKFNTLTELYQYDETLFQQYQNEEINNDLSNLNENSLASNQIQEQQTSHQDQVVQLVEHQEIPGVTEESSEKFQELQEEIQYRIPEDHDGRIFVIGLVDDKEVEIEIVLNSENQVEDENEVTEDKGEIEEESQQEVEGRGKKYQEVEDEEEIIQVLNIFPALIKNTKEIHSIAKIRKVNKESMQITESFIYADNLTNKLSTMKLVYDYFIANLEMHGKPVLMNCNDKNNIKQ